MRCGWSARTWMTRLSARCREECFHPGLRRRIPDGIQPYLFGELRQALHGRRRDRHRRQFARRPWIGQTPRAASVAWRHRPVAHQGRGGGRSSLRILPDVLMSELPEDVRDQVSVNAVAGPVLAYELSGRRISATVFAGNDEAVLRTLRDIFHATTTGSGVRQTSSGWRCLRRSKNAYVVGHRRGARHAGGGGRARRDRRGHAQHRRAAVCGCGEGVGADRRHGVR